MDTFLYYISQFSQDYVVFPLIIFGILFLDRQLFLRIVVLLLFGIAINVFLKNVFQVPLNPELHKDWWAFPSGHVQLTATFYGYLAYHYRNLFLSIAVALILIGESFSVVHFKYHDWMDVIGGLVAAGVWIVTFEVIRKSAPFRNRFYLFALILLPLAFILERFSSKVPGVHQIVLGAFIGVTLGLWFDQFVATKKTLSFIEVLLVLGGAVAFYFGISYMLGTSVPAWIHLSKPIGILMLYALPTFWIVCGSRIAGTLLGRRKG